MWTLQIFLCPILLFGEDLKSGDAYLNRDRCCQPNAVRPQAQVELYMPKEDILVEGDYVNELFVLVSGDVQVTRILNLGARPWTLDPGYDPDWTLHADANRNL